MWNRENREYSMMLIKKVLHEPLLHFLLIGGGLFLLFNVMNGG